MRDRLHEAAEKRGVSPHAFALRALQAAIDEALREVESRG